MLVSVHMFDTEALKEIWRDEEGRRRLVGTGAAALSVIVLSVTVFFRLTHPMPDFSEFEAGPERKTRFFAFLRPLVEAENARILEQRQRIQEIAADGRIGWLERRRLRSIAEDYGLAGEDMDTDALVETLLRRVDAVPMSLALAQAAKESGWGTSRFARRGFNLFGEWCYEPGCGLVPKSRAEGRRQEVEAFASPRHSVRSYLKNINTHRSYRGFRTARAQLRATGRPLSGLVLAGELQRYSERGSDYVREIRQLIRVNELERAAGDQDA